MTRRNITSGTGQLRTLQLVCAALMGEDRLEVLVGTADDSASRSCVFALNRLAPDPNAEHDPQCPEPDSDALFDAVAEMESGPAQ